MRARNKVAMRRRWKEVGVPIPRFLSATDEESLFEAVERLRLPVVVKLADGAGSIGHTIINQKDEVPSAIAKLNRARSIATAKGTSPYYKSEYTEFIVEELIQASTDGWYRESGYGDYLSVEGLVVNGIYRPIAISGRFPSIPPFTELGNHTPVPIEAERIAVIEHEARRAVDALQLNFCATHTEMKLCQDGTVCLLESAARLAGAAVIPMVEAAYGIDLIGMWVRVLMDQTLEFTNHLLGLRDARCAAANIPIISVNFEAKPWDSSQRFWHDIDWSPLVSNETKVQISQGQTVPSGTLIEPYDSAIGVLNYAGRLLVTANDPITLKKDAMSLINGMESLLAAESTRRLAKDLS